MAAGSAILLMGRPRPGALDLGAGLIVLAAATACFWALGVAHNLRLDWADPGSLVRDPSLRNLALLAGNTLAMLTALGPLLGWSCASCTGGAKDDDKKKEA